LLAYIPLILTSVSLNALAQILLKQGMVSIGRFEFVAGQVSVLLPKIAFNPFVIGGMGCYALSIGLWLVVLSRVEVSAAYPFLSVGYIIAAAAGYWLFEENLGVARVLGIALICCGVVLISRS
jgi:multidrug transporter EmrE-like cation transporter